MTSSRRQIVTGGLMGVLTGLLVYRVAPYFRVYNVDVGDKAPGFNLTADAGTGMSLEDYRGKYVLLNFWATWCPPCIQELPSLNNIHERFRDRGLVVVGVSVDEDKEAYQKFLQQRGVTFPTARDPQQTVNIRYGTTKFPESYLIDREGYVRRKYVGPEDWERPEIVNYLSSLL